MRPLARHSATQRIALDTLTPNRAAAWRRLAPVRTASITVRDAILARPLEWRTDEDFSAGRFRAEVSPEDAGRALAAVEAGRCAVLYLGGFPMWFAVEGFEVAEPEGDGPHVLSFSGRRVHAEAL